MPGELGELGGGVDPGEMREVEARCQYDVDGDGQKWMVYEK